MTWIWWSHWLFWLHHCHNQICPLSQRRFLSGFKITMLGFLFRSFKTLYFFRSATVGLFAKTYELTVCKRSATTLPFCFLSLRCLIIVPSISSRQVNTSYLLIRGGQIEWVNPNFKTSSCCDVRLQDDMLVTVSFDVNRKTALYGVWFPSKIKV